MYMYMYMHVYYCTWFTSELEAIFVEERERSESIIVSAAETGSMLTAMRYMFLNERREGRKKEARSNKQTRQSNTAHPR